MKTSLVIATALSLMNQAGVISCVDKWVRSQDAKHPVNSAVTKSEPPVNGQHNDDPSELKVLAQGSHSEVASPFVAVARDPRTYAELRKLAPVLPKLADEFFVSHAVVAAFMGQRNTGGYNVEITRTIDGPIRVTATAPPKGSMVPQVITTPFKVVSVSPRSPIVLEVDGVWQQAMRTYRITSGQFGMGGGFAGIREQFDLEGKIRVMRAGKLATFIFNLKSTNAEKQRALEEAASGLIEEGAVNISRVGAGSLIEMPHGDLSVSGTLTDKNSKLMLRFASLPTMIADGYGGGGSVSGEDMAVAPMTKPSPAKDPI